MPHSARIPLGRPGGRALSPCITLATMVLALALPRGASGQIPDRFSWGKVQNHPLAAPGAIHEGLPDGNYLTPNEDQQKRCLTGCVLYATVGAMEMMFKIQHKDPRLTLDLDEGAILDDRGVQNGTHQTTERFCGCDCSDATSMTLSCVPQTLESEGLPREGVSDGVVYTIDSYDSFGPSNMSWDQLRNRILRGPVAATVEVDETAAGQKYLNHSECEPGFPCTPKIHHRVLIVGYSQDAGATGAAANRKLEIKNSWGPNERGLSSLQWLRWDDPAWYKSLTWLQVEGVSASNTALDSDGDTTPNHLDICPTQFSGRLTANGRVQPNLDNDDRGDECDPDLDGDGVDDLFDCAPHNRYIGYDLDQDGVCDDPEMLVETDGTPVVNLLENSLHTPAFKDYKDAWTLFSESSDHAAADGDDDPAVDLSLAEVCANQCARLAQMPMAVRPGGYSLAACLDRCNPATTPRDSCSPMSTATPADWPFHHCRAVWECATATSQWACDTYSLTERVRDCRNHWHNPGDGQVDGDGDGVGDFCDEEPTVKRLSMGVGTQSQQLPGEFGFENPLMRCYKDRYQIRFDTWGGRGRDGSSGEGRDGVSIAACYCPGQSWDASCQLYCPTMAETPNSGDAAHNPGPGNQAWDPISDPDHCMSKLDINAEQDYHLCRDRLMTFRGQGYEGPPLHRYAWRWQPFYDPDRTDSDGVYEVHPSLAYSETNPGLVKLRVAWPNRGQTPGIDEKTFLSEAQQMKAGCFFVRPNLDKWLRLSPEQVFPPSSLYAPRFVLPNETVSDFERLTRPEAALALFGDELVALDPLTGAVQGARAIAYGGSARLTGPTSGAATASGAAGANLAAMGVMGQQSLPAMVFAAADAQATPVIVLIEGQSLWLGFPALGNLWGTWPEAYPESPLPPGEPTAVVASRSGVLMLLTREADDEAALVAYRLQQKAWAEQGRLPGAALAPEVTGYRLALDDSARHLFFVGGEGPGFSALVHRWDLRAGRLAPLPLPALDGWQTGRKSLGVHLAGETLFVVGPPGLARVELLTGRVRLLAEEVPTNLGQRPFVYVDDRARRLSVIPVSTGTAFEVSTLELATSDPATSDPAGAGPQWTSRPFLDTTERAVDAASGTLQGGEGARLIFKPAEGDEGAEHRASLVASSPEVTLRVRDAAGLLVGEARDATLQKELRFTPAADEPFHVVEAVPSGALDPALLVSYALSVEPADGVGDGGDDGGCSCDTGRDGGLGPVPILLPMVLLPLILRRRARRRRVGGALR